jgi:hypothetical protein
VGFNEFLLFDTFQSKSVSGSVECANCDFLNYFFEKILNFFREIVECFISATAAFIFTVPEREIDVC